MKHFYSSLVACMLLAANLPILAETAGSGFQVSAGTVGKCSITADALAFNENIPTPIIQEWTVTGGIRVLCSPATIYRVALDLGTGNGKTCAARKMTNVAGPSTSTLDYNLYTKTTTASSVFGDGVTCGEDSGERTGTGVTQTIIVYGQIPFHQNPDRGSFSDLVTATMTF